MINLLPYEEKKEVEKERLRRFTIVVIFSISVIFLLCILLIIPVYFSLYQERASLIEEENSLKRGAPAEKMKFIIENIKKTTSKISIIESSANNKSIPEILKKIIDSIPPGVSISGISFNRLNTSERGKVSLSGKANSREDLTTFTNILNNSGLFDKVDSPVSNILKKNNVDFLINLELK